MKPADDRRNMKNMKMMNAMRMKLFCLATFAMAMTAAHLTAQVFTTLHSFTGGSEGSGPVVGVILSGNTLYGTADQGTSFGYGTVFKVNTDGTGFKVLETFNGVNNEAYPETSLLLSGSTLYGASGGPGTTMGTLFAVNTNGTGFTTLHIFTTLTGAHYTNSDGGEVWGPLILSGNTLYGTAQFGSSGGMGMVFAVNTNGTGLTTLHSFAALSVPFDPFGSSGSAMFVMGNSFESGLNRDCNDTRKTISAAFGAGRSVASEVRGLRGAGEQGCDSHRGEAATVGQ